MAQHHALGLAGGTACVKDGRQFVGIVAGRGQLGTFSLCQPEYFVFIKGLAALRQIFIFQRRQARLRAHQHGRAAIGQNMRNLGPFEQWVDWHMHQPRPRRRQWQHTSQLAFCRPACHSIALGRTTCQPSGQKRDTFPQLLKGKSAITQHQRRCLCTPALGQLIERIGRGIRH